MATHYKKDRLSVTQQFAEALMDALSSPSPVKTDTNSIFRFVEIYTYLHFPRVTLIDIFSPILAGENCYFQIPRPRAVLGALARIWPFVNT